MLSKLELRGLAPSYYFFHFACLTFQSALTLLQLLLFHLLYVLLTYEKCSCIHNELVIPLSYEWLREVAEVEAACRFEFPL